MSKNDIQNGNAIDCLNNAIKAYENAKNVIKANNNTDEANTIVSMIEEGIETIESIKYYVIELYNAMYEASKEEGDSK